MSRETIAKVLKDKRKAAQLTVEKVTEQLKQQFQIEISSKSIYSYESGHRQPDADTLMALCDIYGISDVMGTFRDTESEQKEESLAQQEDSAETRDIAVRLYRALIAGGWIKEGQDITEQQLEMLDGVSKILSALFDQ